MIWAKFKQDLEQIGLIFWLKSLSKWFHCYPERYIITRKSYYLIFAFNCKNLINWTVPFWCMPRSSTQKSSPGKKPGRRASKPCPTRREICRHCWPPAGAGWQRSGQTGTSSRLWRWSWCCWAARRRGQTRTGWAPVWQSPLLPCRPSRKGERHGMFSQLCPNVGMQSLTREVKEFQTVP